jgi:hypothetical protein
MVGLLIIFLYTATFFGVGDEFAVNILGSHAKKKKKKKKK